MDDSDFDDLRNMSLANVQPESQTKPSLRAATSLAVFAIYFLGQVFLAIAATVFILIQFSLDGVDLNNQANVNELIDASMPQIMLVSFFGGALGLALGALIVKKSLKDNTQFGAAWTKGQPANLFKSLFLGIGAALAYFLFPLVVIPPTGESMGPLTQLAHQPGSGQFTWVIIGLFMAPLVEELLFRGILLGGLTRSFGIWWGVLMSNLLFVAVHYFEAIHYWPAFIGIGLLAIVATRQRLVSKSIGPAIGVHFGYNFVMVIALMVSI